MAVADGAEEVRLRLDRRGSGGTLGQVEEGAVGAGRVCEAHQRAAVEDSARGAETLLHGMRARTSSARRRRASPGRACRQRASTRGRLPSGLRPAWSRDSHHSRTVFGPLGRRNVVRLRSRAWRSWTPPGGREELSPDRAWWLRVPAVLVGPRPVFFALREEDPDDVAARSEPILLIVGLAGAAAVLATPTAGGLLDNPEYDPLLLAVWTFIAGSIYGAVGYFVLGFALFFGARLLGSLGSFRRERQLVGFAAVPLAVSFLLVLPLRLAIYGGDTFSKGGADEGTGEAVLLGLQLVFVAWSLALLLVGVKVVHGWSWPRSLGAVRRSRGLGRRDRRPIRDDLARRCRGQPARRARALRPASSTCAAPRGSGARGRRRRRPRAPLGSSPRFPRSA